MIRANEHHSPRHAHRLLRWHRLALYGTGAVLLLTGIVWLAIHYSIGAGTGELPHPIEVWTLRLHGLAGFAGLFMLGVLAGTHIPRGWRLSHRRRWAGQLSTGVALCVMGGLLTLTGYALYYFASEAVRPALGWAHAIVGGVMATLIASHRRGA
jgi:hypothetical protein